MLKSTFSLLNPQIFDRSHRFAWFFFPSIFPGFWGCLPWKPAFKGPKSEVSPLQSARRGATRATAAPIAISALQRRLKERRRGDSNGGESQEETGADGNFGEKNWELGLGKNLGCYKLGMLWKSHFSPIPWDIFHIAERTMVTASPLLVVTWDALRIIWFIKSPWKIRFYNINGFYFIMGWYSNIIV